MKPSEKVVVENGSFVEKTQVDARDYTSWMDGVLTLQGESVNDIAEMLSQYYGVKIVCNHVNSTPLYGKTCVAGFGYGCPENYQGNGKD